jgi:hypothetical protein
MAGTKHPLNGLDLICIVAHYVLSATTPKTLRFRRVVKYSKIHLCKFALGFIFGFSYVK